MTLINMAVSLRKGVSLFRSQLCRYRTASCICKKTVHSSAQTDTRDNSGEEAQTHFGFQTVSEHEKAEKGMITSPYYRSRRSRD